MSVPFDLDYARLKIGRERGERDRETHRLIKTIGVNFLYIYIYLFLLKSVQTVLVIK